MSITLYHHQPWFSRVACALELTTGRAGHG